jgi:hypothetical protein
MSPPSSGSKNKHARALLAPCFKLVSYLAHSSTPKMEAICSPETSVDFHRTSLRYIPADRTLHGSFYFKSTKSMHTQKDIKSLSSATSKDTPAGKDQQVRLVR